MTNKLYAQYREHPDAVSLSEIPAHFTNQFVSASGSVRDSYDISSNSGEALDVIGRIVGRDRSYIESRTFDVYECNSSGEFECGDSSAQCSAVSAAHDSDLSDQYYRYLLRAQIAKNSSDATIDSILTVVNTAVPALNALRLVDGENMTFSIEFYGSIDPIARDLLISGEIVPTPAGVEFVGYLQGVNMSVCNSSGEFECGDSAAQCVGFLGV